MDELNFARICYEARVFTYKHQLDQVALHINPGNVTDIYRELQYSGLLDMLERIDRTAFRIKFTEPIGYPKEWTMFIYLVRGVQFGRHEVLDMEQSGRFRNIDATREVIERAPTKWN